MTEECAKLPLQLVIFYLELGRPLRISDSNKIALITKPHNRRIT